MRFGQRWKWAIFGLAVASAGVIAADSPWKPGISESQLSKLIASHVEVIEQAAGNGFEERRTTNRARAAAVMAAATAQSAMLGNKTKAEQFAGLRDHAIKLAAAIKAGKTDQVKTLAGELKAAEKLTGNSDAVDLAQHLDLDALMHQFKPEKGGGRGWESRLKSLMGKKSALASDEIKESAQIGLQIAMVAQFTEAYAPTADAGKKKKADWLKWTRDMGESGFALAKSAEAAKPNDQTIKNGLRKVEESCVKCHAVFRD